MSNNINILDKLNMIRKLIKVLSKSDASECDKEPLFDIIDDLILDLKKALE